MAPVSTAIYQVAQIRELETLARERFTISSDILMQRAGKAAFQFLLKCWPQAKSIAVMCGAGNNGGDGYVLAEIAHKHGMKVIVWQVGKTHKSKALAAHDACEKAGVSIKPFLNQADLETVDVVVDAIIGIGLRDELQPEVSLAIEMINRSQLPVLALDVPSGINADTGAVTTIAVNATATITFIGMKLGLLTGKAITYVGKVYCDDLQLPAQLLALVAGPVEKITYLQFAEYLKPRPRDAHKGIAGHVLVVGGDAGYAGAPRMAAEAALRVGAGLVTIATHPSHAAVMNLSRPEIMCSGVQSSRELHPLLEKATVVIIGPGLGQSVWAKKLLKKVLGTNLPLLLDADALNLLAKKPTVRSNWILTPHPGEAARLLGTNTEVVQKDRLAALITLQRMFGGICVLKGAGSLVLAPNQTAAICDAGNPGMASGGMGDVLSGVIAGLMAQRVPLDDAAKLGVYLHALAGDLAAEEGGQRGLIATDLMPYLRKLMNMSTL